MLACLDWDWWVCREGRGVSFRARARGGMTVGEGLHLLRFSWDWCI